MNTKKVRPARGMRDWLPADARRRTYVVDTLRELFVVHGFEPLITPAPESAETLLGKYGPDAERLIYRAGLGAKQDLALRYDLTVPLARVVATVDGLAMPFRRYQIGSVWRGDRPQKGRFREFLQADVDIVGSNSLLADAELLSIVAQALPRLGFTNHLMMVNNRKILTAIGQYSGVPDSMLPGLYRAIDKRDRVGLEGVRLELRAVGLPREVINRQRQGVERWVRGTADAERLQLDLAAAAEADATTVPQPALDAFFGALSALPNGGPDAPPVREAQEAVMEASIEALREAYADGEVIPDAVTGRLLELVALEGDNRTKIDSLRARLGDAASNEGLEELAYVLELLDATGAPMDRIVVDFAMVRGLDYYTGTILEVVDEGTTVGSILSGGRYDRLVSQFGRDLPAVGVSFGVDRLLVAMDDLGLFADWQDETSADVMVLRFDDDNTTASLTVAQILRAEGIRVEQYLDLDGVGDQLRYAARGGYPAVIIIGPDEAATGQATVRDMTSRAESRVALSDVVPAVRAVLSSGAG